jgi:hypothetical protein
VAGAAGTGSALGAGCALPASCIRAFISAIVLAYCARKAGEKNRLNSSSADSSRSVRRVGRRRNSTRRRLIVIS